MTEQISSEISQAVFNTLLYSDVFDYPLTAPEIHRYLSGRTATYEEVCLALRSDPRFIKDGKFYTLAGRGEVVRLREKREQRSQTLLSRALAYGRILGALPFVRMVALTGSLAVCNVSNDEDFDYMLVTEPGRLWTARAFVLLFARLTRRAGHTVCPNVIVTLDSLEWGRHDLYSARDLCQMIPIAGMGVYRRLMKANDWVRDFLPNAYGQVIASPLPDDPRHLPKLQGILEAPLRGSLGDRFEGWEMDRKIERFSRQEGFGEETVFNQNICQGNFDHHRRWTQQEFRKRVEAFNRETHSEAAGVGKRIA